MIQNSSKINFNIQISYENYIEYLKAAHIEEDDVFHCKRVWNELYGKNNIAEIPINIWNCEDVQATTADCEPKVITIMTLGDFFDKKIEVLETKEELLMAYIVDAFAMKVLMEAYDRYREVYYEKKHSYLENMIFFDEKEMKTVPTLLNNLGIKEVYCNDAYTMIPQKTVIFRSKTTLKRSAVCENICSQCNNITCEHRINANRAPKNEDIQSQKLNYGYQRILGNRGNGLW